MDFEDYNSTYEDSYTDDFDTIVALEEFSPLEGRVVRIFLVVVYSIICFLGILGNGLVIVIATFKMKKSTGVRFPSYVALGKLFHLFEPQFSYLQANIIVVKLLQSTIWHIGSPHTY